MTTPNLDERFAFHPADTAEKREQHETIRGASHPHAPRIDEALPDGREKATALTKLEEAMFWANAGIARPVHERTPRPGA
jgi:hypothetical protein